MNNEQTALTHLDGSPIRVMVVEDDPLLNELLTMAMRAEGWEAHSATHGHDALALARDASPDVVIMDIMIPGIDGVEVVRRLRARGDDVPVLFLTAKDELEDKLKGLSAGGDDYVTKPFTPLELLARVNSHLRRYSKYLTAVSGEEQEKSHVYTIGGLELNEETVEVTVDGEAVKLTPMEFKIVQLLIKNPGRVFSADEIYERIWNEKAVNTDTIMVHVRNIREKIEIDPRNPKYLKVVWGVGYKIDKQ